MISGHEAAGRRRADLQGIRAVAVLAVLAYHFDMPGISGGFIGVDVFFVLSGFFICRLLLREYEEQGRIRLLLFWANRAKRLLPNGLLCILATLVASILLLPSHRLPGISEDASAAAAFFSNFHFAAQAVNYFQLDVPESPFLHFWSLAVEEQFYLVLPVLIMLALLTLRRNDPRIVVLVLLLGVALASLAGALWMIGTDQPRAFFHPQFRVWQLALGGCVGMVFAQRQRIAPSLRSAIALLGLLAIAAAMVLLDDDMPYPGIWALLPTLGTAGLILGVDARPEGWLRGGLALQPMTHIGDMSYSLYLWHWPVAVFLSAFWPAGDLIHMALGIALSVALAWLAYHFVERPLHRRSLAGWGAGRVLAGALGCVAITSTLAFAVTFVPGRSDPAIKARIAEATADLGENYANGCHLGLEDVVQPECRFARLGGPRVVLWGDSHAAQWFSPLVLAAEQAGWEAVAWTKTSCPTPEISIWYAPSSAVYDQCDRWRQERLTALLENPPELVILGNSSRYYTWVYDAAANGPAGAALRDRLWRDGFERTANQLLAAGIRVVDVRDTPHMYANYKDCLSAGDWTACHRPRDQALEGLVNPVIESTLFQRLDLSDALCDALRCWASLEETILYRDNHHLTARYAASLHDRFETVLAGALGKP